MAENTINYIELISADLLEINRTKQALKEKLIAFGVLEENTSTTFLDYADKLVLGSVTPTLSPPATITNTVEKEAIVTKDFKIKSGISVGTPGWIKADEVSEIFGYYEVKDGSATLNTTYTALTSAGTSATTIATQHFSITPTASVSTAGWINSINDGTTQNYTIASGTISTGSTNQTTYVQNTSAIVPADGYLYIGEGWYPNTQISLSTLIPNDGNYSDAVLNAAKTGCDQILSGYEAYSVDGEKLVGTIPILTPNTTTTYYQTTNSGYGTLGPGYLSQTYYIKPGSATTPTNSTPLASTSTTLSGTTLTVQAIVTPTVTEGGGWVSSGTAGTVKISGIVPTEAKTVTSSGDITPSDGKLLSKVTVPAGSASVTYSLVDNGSTIGTEVTTQNFKIDETKSVTAGWINSVTSTEDTAYSVRSAVGSAASVNGTASYDTLSGLSLVDENSATAAQKASGMTFRPIARNVSRRYTVSTAGWITAGKTYGATDGELNGSTYYITAVTIPKSKTLASVTLTGGAENARTYLTTLTVNGYTTITTLNNSGIIEKISNTSGILRLIETSGSDGITTLTNGSKITTLNGSGTITTLGGSNKIGTLSTSGAITTYTGTGTITRMTGDRTITNLGSDAENASGSLTITYNGGSSSSYKSSPGTITVENNGNSNNNGTINVNTNSEKGRINVKTNTGSINVNGGGVSVEGKIVTVDGGTQVTDDDGNLIEATLANFATEGITYDDYFNDDTTSFKLTVKEKGEGYIILNPLYINSGHISNRKINLTDIVSTATDAEVQEIAGRTYNK